MKTFNTGFQTKWLLFFGLVLLPAMAFGQIKLSQSMSPGGTFGLVDVNELKGGVMMVDSLELRESIFMNRTKRGLMVVVIDADSVQAGDQTKTYMFLPSEDPTDYADGGKVWNTYDEFPVHTVAEFRAKYGVEPWVEVSLGLKDPDGPGIDSIFISTSFIDTIYANTGDTLFLMDKAKTDSLYTNYLNISGVEILGISVDATFANASNDSIVSQLAVKTFVDDMFTAFGQNATIDNLIVDTLTADSAFINELQNKTFVSDSINVDTLVAVYAAADTVSANRIGVNYFTLSGYWVATISNDTTFASSDSTALVTEYAVQTRIDSVLQYVDGQFSALSQNMIEDTQDGETMVKVTDGDSVIFRIANDTAIVIDPAKNINIIDANIVLNGDSIYEVADRGEAFTSDADSAKAVTSLSTVDSMIADGGNDINFAFGTKKVTRAGWPGVSGNSVNADNLEEFLQKLFFPMPPPLINTFGTPAQSTQTVDVNGNIISSVGTISIPYATWVADAGITFSFDVDNRTDAASDPADELPAQAITSIRVTKGGSDVGTYAIGDGTTDQAGTIAVNAADVTVNPTGTSANVFTLVVEDEYPNTNTLDVNVNMTAALQSLVENNVDITHPSSEGSNPYLIERNGATQTFTVTYRVDSRDETVTDVIYTPTGGITAPANETGLNITTDNVVRTINIDIENTNLNVVRLGVQVQGDIYNTPSTQRQSPTIQLADRGYVGYLTNAQRLDVGTQAATIAAFSNPLCLMNYQFKNSAGVTLQNNIGETGYLCFAIPVSKEGLGKSYKIQTFAVGDWYDVGIVGQTIMSITTNGNTTDYYVVYINDVNGNTFDGDQVIARILEN